MLAKYSSAGADPEILAEGGGGGGGGSPNIYIFFALVIIIYRGEMGSIPIF